jgi:hypothetical protein
LHDVEYQDLLPPNDRVGNRSDDDRTFWCYQRKPKKLMDSGASIGTTNLKQAREIPDYPM